MIIGIDLGTTNSLAAYFSENGPEVIPNAFGENLTPSVVSVDDGGVVYVGKIAVEHRLSRPENTAAVFKRSMGSGKLFDLGSRKFTAEELSSFVIKKLVDDAQNFLGAPVTEAVISTPAYFNDAQRRAVRQAGELAGIRVDRIISEPTAAALAYGLHELKSGSKFLVFDLGGGTFDVSVLEFSNGVMEVNAVAGDNYLGGEDFNEVLARILLTRANISPRDLGLRDFVTLSRAAEAAKIQFGERPQAVMEWSFGDREISETITTAEFEEGCAKLLSRLKTPIVRAVTDAQLKLPDLDVLTLVGGATRMPLIAKFVSKLFGQYPIAGLNPDEAVALGAAVQAAMKGRDAAVRELIFTDVCPYTLGTDVSVREGGYTRTGVFHPIIERNTVIPASRRDTFYTCNDNQTSVSVQILQGESRRVADNILLGTLEVPVPPGPAGSQAVAIRYTYDINGILEVEVTVPSTGETRKTIIEKNPGQYTPEQVQARLAELASLKMHPRDKEVNRFLLERAERYYTYSTGEYRVQVGEALSAFESALDIQDPKLIVKRAETLKEVLDAGEDDIYEW